MIRQWRHLKMLKRSGYGHLEDEVEKQSHSCALLCPACPHPGINLPPNLENTPKEKRFGFKSDHQFYLHADYFITLFGYTHCFWPWMAIFE